MSAQPPTGNILLDAALAYAALPWPVFPIWWPLAGGGCGCGKAGCGQGGKHPITARGLLDATTDTTVIRGWWYRWPRANIAVNCGLAGIVVVDIDLLKGGESGFAELQARLGADAFPDTVTAETGGGGRHLVYAAHSDLEIRNSASKVAAGVDIRGVGGYIVVPPSLHQSGAFYAWQSGKGATEVWPTPITEELARALAALSLPKTTANGTTGAAVVDEVISEGQRNSTLTSLAGTMRTRGMGEESIYAALVTENGARCVPPLPDDEVRGIARSVARYAPGVHVNGSGPLPASVLTLPPRAHQWPEPPDTAAFHGLAGEFVRLIEPHTEADPVALLGQFLVAFGNVIGRSAHFVAEADRHYSNLYLVLVGETAKGRKGSSLGQVKRLFWDLAPEWTTDRIQEGQSSGEGLIWAVRDAIKKKNETIDAGIDDKRLLCAESEFASLLRVLEREGNTLSAILRQAWDSGTLRALTKNNQAKATGAHISEIGHITADELHRYLLRTEVANGLGNRYLWICVRRSKVLPDGGDASSVDLTAVLQGVQDATLFGATCGELRRDEESRMLWHEVYPELSSGKPGMFGALTARAEAQVMRLAMLYALLDLSGIIRRAHLEAALAFWRYCEASLRYVFFDELGDPVADTIMASLRDNPGGLSRTDVSRLFAGNRGADELNRALARLVSQGLIEIVREKTAGRPMERIRLPAAEALLTS